MEPFAAGAGAGVGPGEANTGPGVVITVVPTALVLQGSWQGSNVLQVQGGGQIVCWVHSQGHGWQAGIGAQMGTGADSYGMTTGGDAAPALVGCV